MTNHLNHQAQEAANDQQLQPEKTKTGSKQETSGQQKPGDRLKDGTNDFQNGDQNETSQGSPNKKESL